MHLSDHILTHETAILTSVISASGLALAAARLARDPLPLRQIPLAMAAGFFVFAAQMVNFPILPHASAHLVGTLLLVGLFGPAAAVVGMAAILALQVALLGDGSWHELGANVFNMALVPVGLALVLGKKWPQRRVFSLLGSAFASISLVSLLIPLQIALFRSSSQLQELGSFTVNMVSSHLLVGLCEAGLTVGLLGLLGAWRGDEVAGRPRGAGWDGRRVAAAALLGLGLLGLSHGSSERPDGYEASLQRSGLQMRILEK